MQAEQAPGRVLESVELVQKGSRQLLAPDQLFECLVHIERRGDKPRAHRAAVREFDPSRASVLDDDPFDLDLRLIAPAGCNEAFHQSAREIERATLTQLIPALEIEGAG